MEQLKDLLTKKAQQFRRTSILVIGRQELQKRGAWTGAIRELAEKEEFDELAELDSFVSWLNAT